MTQRSEGKVERGVARDGEDSWVRETENKSRSGGQTKKVKKGSHEEKGYKVRAR